MVEVEIQVSFPSQHAIVSVILLVASRPSFTGSHAAAPTTLCPRPPKAGCQAYLSPFLVLGPAPFSSPQGRVIRSYNHHHQRAEVHRGWQNPGLAKPRTDKSRLFRAGGGEALQQGRGWADAPQSARSAG